ncbi:MAG TPA: hypothetical protein VGH62_13540, partial [Bradyrhizobium sp.]
AVAAGRSQMARRVESARVFKAIARRADASMIHRLCINPGESKPAANFCRSPIELLQCDVRAVTESRRFKINEAKSMT